MIKEWIRVRCGSGWCCGVAYGWLLDATGAIMDIPGMFAEGDAVDLVRCRWGLEGKNHEHEGICMGVLVCANCPRRRGAAEKVYVLRCCKSRFGGKRITAGARQNLELLVAWLCAQIWARFLRSSLAYHEDIGLLCCMLCDIGRSDFSRENHVNSWLPSMLTPVTASLRLSVLVMD